MRPDVTIASKYGPIEKQLYPELIDQVKRNGGNVDRIPRAEIEKHIILTNQTGRYIYHSSQYERSTRVRTYP